MLILFLGYNAKMIVLTTSGSGTNTPLFCPIYSLQIFT